MHSLNNEVLPPTNGISPTRTEVQPLVSIMLFCKNGGSAIRRCVESVLNQSYDNFELVVQDGASTDSTLETLRSYNDRRIKIVSEKDSGPGEAFWKVLNRCEGRYIGTCLADEELLPGAIEQAVARFANHPDVGAITGDGYVSDLNGKITGDFIAGDFNIVDYLFGRYCPLWPASFFRRQALLDVGLKTHQWTIECLEFEIWCRLGTQHVVKYFPGRVAKYGVHEAQLSNTAQHFTAHFNHRAAVIQEMFSENGFFGHDELKLKGCLYNQLFLLYSHVKAYKLMDQAALLASRLKEIRDSVTGADQINAMQYFNFVGDGLSSSEKSIVQAHVFRRINRIWTMVALRVPPRVRKLVPRRAKMVMYAAVTLAVFLLFNTRHFLQSVFKYLNAAIKGDKLKKITTAEFSHRLYHEVAQRYYARGQIAQALQLWKKAETLNDPMIDGLACQAMLMLPNASSLDLAEAQKRWAKKHATPLPELPTLVRKPFDNDRPISVGYFCAFFDSYVFQSQLGQALKYRNRNRFRIFGYSVTPVPAELKALFDDFKVTGAMPDDEFVSLVRRDNLDVCVELTGFSPLNRFSAMASRCAPVQISYLNHTGTSGVPNVDFVIADDTGVTRSEESCFTESVLRLPGCFFCFNYEWDDVPLVSEPPFEARGFVTFGTFSSGGKVNDSIIALWAKVMHRVPDSRLIIGNHQLSSSSNREFLVSRFLRCGIDKDRVQLFGGVERHEALRRYDKIDISLDTWPYCGGNSVAEAIWQGVPTITLRGNRFSSRYGASLVNAAGCPELVASSEGEYINIAVSLAQSPERLRQYRKNLRAMSGTFGLSDAQSFCRKLEAGLESVVRRSPLREVGDPTTTVWREVATDAN